MGNHEPVKEIPVMQQEPDNAKADYARGAKQLLGLLVEISERTPRDLVA